MSVSEYAIIGRIRKPQGIGGDVCVELLTQEPERLLAPGRRVFAGTVDGDIASHPSDRRNPSSREELRVEHASPYRGGLVIKFDAIRDRTAAELWRQRYLLVPASELTPLRDDEVFMHDLIGMRVRGDDGREIGEVTACYELPHGLALGVRGAAHETLVPYCPPTVIEVDRDARVVLVDTASGLFE